MNRSINHGGGKPQQKWVPVTEYHFKRMYERPTAYSRVHFRTDGPGMQAEQTYHLSANTSIRIFFRSPNYPPLHGLKYSLPKQNKLF